MKYILIEKKSVLRMQPIIVNQVVKRRPHQAAHPHISLLLGSKLLPKIEPWKDLIIVFVIIKSLYCLSHDVVT